MITLLSDRLRVEISEPNECPNNGSRFDRSGFISNVVLDGAIHFGANEPKNLWHPSTGGRGFCSEYLADYSAEASNGDFYPKFGVGLIPKGDEEQFVFHKRYENIQEFPVHIAKSDNSAVFTAEPIPCLGYAMRAKKTVTVLSNSLIIETEAVNTGDKTINISEYCHNFISVDGMAISPDYRLDFPSLMDFGLGQMLDIAGTPCNFKGNGRGVTFLDCQRGVAHIRLEPSDIKGDVPFTWRLSNDGAKAFVEVQEHFLPDSIEVWSIDHIISPEVFHKFSIKPGESHCWKRSWLFDVY